MRAWRTPVWVATRALPELVEAGARADRPDVATAAATRLAESGLAGGTEWGLGMLDRSRALLVDDRDAKELYRSAIDHLKRCRAVPNLARAQLVYGGYGEKGVTEMPASS
jgi:hypothetical protein